jgi:hypothetical protein
MSIVIYNLAQTNEAVKPYKDVQVRFDAAYRKIMHPEEASDAE